MIYFSSPFSSFNDEKQGAITENQSSLNRDNNSFSLIAKKKINLTLIIVGIHVYTPADDEIIESTFSKKSKATIENK